MARIPQAFIDELLARVDIVDVVDSRVPLKKGGKELKACCPFHNEKTPSFTVSPSKQFYHCFGCGAHGTAISFLMEYDHLSFVEAVEELARRAGLTVPREGGVGGDQRREQDATGPLLDALSRADRFFQKQLREHPQATTAVEYLKQRGLTGEIAREFGIGYAPPGWHNLGQALAELPKRVLVEAGLLIEKEGGRHYDRFRERVMFPIRDRRGRVIGFGGRVLGDDTPKYLNSPETPVFHKGRELYGFWEVRQALRHIPRLMVVEGYMDVVALAQFGIRNAVATLGTSLTRDHLETIFRTTEEVVFCFDGDRAGREAAWRGLETALPFLSEGRQVRFLFLPDGEDPDTLVRKVGREAFEALAAKAEPLSEFVVDQLGRNADLSRVDGRARLVELARPMIEAVPKGVYRRLLIERLAERARMPGDEMLAMFGETPPGAPRSNRPGPRAKAGSKQPPSPVRHAVTLLLQKPALAAEISDPRGLADLPLPGIALMTALLELLHRQPNLTTGALIEHWRGMDEGRHLANLAAQTLLSEGDDLEEEFRDTLKKLETMRRELRRDELMRKPLRELSGAEKIELQQLLMGQKV